MSQYAPHASLCVRADRHIRQIIAVKSIPMPTDTSQLEFWSHVQSERIDLFHGSKSRLDSLLRRSEKFAGGRSLLNIGCGNGYLERAAQQKNWKVLSVDPDAKSIARLKTQGIDARCGMIEALPVNSDSVDVVICTEVLEHLLPDSMESGLKEIRRILVPGGVLIGTVPWRENLADNQVFCPHCNKTFHRWGHHLSFDESKMRSVLNSYFSVLKIRPVYFPTWNVADWKGKLAIAARVAFGAAGIHGSNSSLLYIARKNS